MYGHFVCMSMWQECACALEHLLILWIGTLDDCDQNVGIKFGSTGRTASALNCLAISPASEQLFMYVMDYQQIHKIKLLQSLQCKIIG